MATKIQPLDLFHVVCSRRGNIQQWCEGQGIDSMAAFLKTKTEIESLNEYYVSQPMVDAVAAHLANTAKTVEPTVVVPVEVKEEPSTQTKDFLKRKGGKKLGSNENPDDVLSSIGSGSPTELQETATGDLDHHESKDS